MKTKLFTCLFATAGILFFCAEITAQIPTISWQKSLGGSGEDAAYSIQQTSDGGYITIGYSSSDDGDASHNYGDYDYWVVKLNSSGNIEWQKSMGGSDTDAPYCIRQTSDGGYIAAGRSYSNDGDVSGNNGNADYWVVKMNDTGNIVWEKSLGGSFNEEAYSIEQTTDGGYIVAGVTDSNDGDVSGNHGEDDCWIVKLDGNGTLEWQKCLGGSLPDNNCVIRQTSDGGYIMAAVSISNDGDVSVNYGGHDYWVVKLNSTGGIVWQKSYGGLASDTPNSVQQTADGGYVIAGFSYSNDGDVSGNHGNGDYWIAKLDASGNLQWQKSLGGSDADIANAIMQTADGGYIIAGMIWSNDQDISGSHGSSDCWLVKLDSTGNLEWEKALGGSAYDEARHSGYR